jgi:hypothetical protein
LFSWLAHRFFVCLHFDNWCFFVGFIFANMHYEYRLCNYNALIIEWPTKRELKCPKIYPKFHPFQSHLLVDLCKFLWY